MTGGDDDLFETRGDAIEKLRNNRFIWLGVSLNDQTGLASNRFDVSHEFHDDILNTLKDKNDLREQ